MQHIKPVSVEEARSKALPILLAGFHRRGRSRSLRERGLRADVKLARDDEQEPRICVL